MEEATNNCVSLLQEADQQATHKVDYKKMLCLSRGKLRNFWQKKRKARAKWQRSHTPSDKTTFNWLSSILISQLKVMRTNSFKNYVSTVADHF